MGVGIGEHDSGKTEQGTAHVQGCRRFQLVQSAWHMEPFICMLVSNWLRWLCYTQLNELARGDPGSKCKQAARDRISYIQI